MEEPKAILFDLGNVLVRFEERADVIGRIIKRFGNGSLATIFYGHGEPAYDALDMGTMSLENLWQHMCALGSIRRSDLPFVLFAALYVEHLRPIEPIVAVARFLQARYPLYALSNGDFGSRYAASMLETHYAVKFEKVFISSEVRIKKPGLIDHAAQRLFDHFRISTGDCIFIDDMPLYIESARGFGMRAIEFNAKMGSPKELIEKLTAAGAAV